MLYEGWIMDGEVTLIFSHLSSPPPRFPIFKSFPHNSSYHMMMILYRTGSFKSSFYENTSYLCPLSFEESPV